MPVWDAEVGIDEDLVRGLLAEQFPELDADSARPLADGWDVSVWVVEGRWAFRFPRREIALRGLARELAVLPRLAPLVPLSIPVPRFAGEPSERFRWPFVGVELVPGREAAECGLTDEERTDLGVALARFLRVLHAPATRAGADQAGELPVDPLGRSDMQVRAARTEEWLAEAVRIGVWQPPPAVDDLLAAARALPRRATPDVLVHGDLHFRHLIVDAGTLSGVIDWGDMCLGDPSIDLQLLWSFVPPGGRASFVAEYGTVDEDQLVRARLLAVFLCAALAVHARTEGLGVIEREALAGLERTLVDWD